eukprot:761556-Hanusia_phi.AAC.3
MRADTEWEGVEKGEEAEGEHERNETREEGKDITQHQRKDATRDPRELADTGDAAGTPHYDTGTAESCNQYQTRLQHDGSDGQRQNVASSVDSIVPKGFWRKLELPRSGDEIAGESSEEDTRDEEYLRRHLPYELSEQQASVRVYADDSLNSCSFLTEADSVLEGPCSFVLSPPPSRLEESCNGADELEEELRASHLIRSADNILISSFRG